MIGTLETKIDQLKNGFYTNGTGKDVILILGSCRSIPYLNYLVLWNEMNNQRFTIHFIDPFNHNWNTKDERTDYEWQLELCEQNEALISMLKNVKIFIHEYYNNAGMFNCNKEAEKNIYQFGLNPEIDVTIPNFNDVFILTADIILWNNDLKKQAIQDYNVIGKLSDQLISKTKEIRELNLKKFYEICQKSDFPEMEVYFSGQYQQKRFFWNSNHITKTFTLIIFKLLNDNFLHLSITKEFTDSIVNAEDMYCHIFTSLTEYDKGYLWNEPIKKLKELL